MTWADLGSHSLAFLLGAATGAAAQYLADKYTDQRRRQEALSAINTRWSKIQSAMPALLEEIKKDLNSNSVVREFIVLPHNRVSFGVGKLQPRFRYYEDEHPNLRGQLAILEDAGYILDVTPGNTPIYRMSEEFVALVQQG